MSGEHGPDGDVTPMLRLLLAMAVTVAIGLASRLYPLGWFLWDRVLGEVLYAVAAYLAVAVFLFRKPPLFIAAIAFVCCLAVELFKLTGIPAEYQHVFLVRWFLGMVYSWVNLGYYFLGVVLTMTVLSALLLLIPFIPGLRDLPRLIPIHRFIWRR